MSVHKDLTGADLHEPKGADTATAGKVYVSDGAGSGVWTAASSIITNTAFTTGDVKSTLKTSADSGWILGAAGSIGDGSSAATIRANSDCEDLFLLLWTNFSNTLVPISGGRGASAAADWAAHKRATLPDIWGRAIGVVGAGTSLTTRTLGQLVGAETHTLATSELPSHTHTNSLSDPGHYHTVGATVAVQAGASYNVVSTTGTSNITGSSFAAVTLTNAAAGSGSSHNNMQPTAFLNLMIKL